MPLKKLPSKKIPLKVVGRVLPSVAASNGSREFGVSVSIAQKWLNEFIKAGTVTLWRAGTSLLPEPTTVSRSLTSDGDFDSATDDFLPKAGKPTGYFPVQNLLSFAGVALTKQPPDAPSTAPPWPSPYRVEYSLEVRPAYAAKKKDAAKPKGGAPAKFEWDQALRALLRQIGEESFRPQKQEDIATWLADHFSQQQGAEPEPSDRRQRAGELFRALNTYAKSKQAGGT